MKKVYVVKIDGNECWHDTSEQALLMLESEFEERSVYFNLEPLEDMKEFTTTEESITIEMRYVTDEEYDEVMSREFDGF